MPRRLTDEERAFRAESEKAFQKRIMDLARMYGWRVAHFHDSRRQVRPGVFVGDADAKGYPDLTLVRPPELIFIEVKAELGKTTPEQEEWLGLLAASGFETFVVRPSGWGVVEKRLMKKRRDSLKSAVGVPTVRA